MTDEFVVSRGISEVLHFTTNHGCLGTLFLKSLKSRARLEGDELVERVFKANAAFRKDTAHLDYVSLSIEHINRSFYNVSSNKWHLLEDVFWVILGFDPSILSHDDVIFTTTNNIYTGVTRGRGRAGLESMYQGSVAHWWGKSVVRDGDLPEAWPTCEQAEVLYPGEVPTSFLRRIYTRSVEEQSEVAGFLKATFHDEVEVVVDPRKFEGRTQ